jgi:HSP20 family protein
MSLAINPRSLQRGQARLRWPSNLVAPREADRLFGDLFRGFGALDSAPSPFVAQKPAGFVPSIDITESEEAFQVSAELPGVKQEDLEIVVEDNVLMLKGEKKDAQESDEKGVRRSEMRFGSFERRVAFRSPISEDDIKARYVDGLLTITIPKPEEARPKVRTVPVESA